MGGRFEAGDALRGIALLCVITFHVAAGAALGPALAQRSTDLFGVYGNVKGHMLDSLQLSVFVFFALSAYLLSWPWFAHVLRGKRKPAVGRYFRHRCFRILPGFWAACVIVFVVYGFQGSSPREVLALLTLLQVYDQGVVVQPIQHAWSLGFEFAFYLALPILALLALRLRQKWLVIGVLGAIVLITAALAKTGLDEGIPVRQSPVGALLAFVPGVLVAWWDAADGWAGLKDRAAEVSWLMLALGMGLFAIMFEIATSGSQPELLLATGAGAIVLAACVLRQRAGLRTWWLLRWKPIQWIGERSFSIFLLHGVVIGKTLDFGEGQPTVLRHMLVNWLLTVPAAIAAGAVLYALVERPALQWAHDRDKQPSPPQSPAPATA